MNLWFKPTKSGKASSAFPVKQFWDKCGQIVWEATVNNNNTCIQQVLWQKVLYEKRGCLATPLVQHYKTINKISAIP